MAEHRWTGFLLFCNATIVLGSTFMCGYNLSVVNGPYALMTQFFNESHLRRGEVLSASEISTEFSFAVTLYLIAGIPGCTWFPGALAASIGKKWGMMIAAAIGAIGSTLIFISLYTGDHVIFIVGRAVVGFQGGLSMVIAPCLINEYAPVSLRGACGSLLSFGFAAGAQFVNLLGLPFILGREHTWHYLFAIAVGIYVIQILSLLFVVESPRWLLDKAREDDAVEALRKLRSSSVQSEVNIELEAMKRTAAEEAKISYESLGTVFHKRELWWPMILAITLRFNQTLTGQNIVMIYATRVMTESGIDRTTASIANFGLCFSLLFGTLLSGYVVDRFGRRPLELVGTTGMLIFNIFLVVVISQGSAIASIAGFAALLLSYSLGPGPIAWYMPAEMFTQSVRPLGLSVAMYATWIGCITVNLIFPIMQMRVGCYSFLPMAAFALGFLIFFVFFLPETGSKLTKFSPLNFASGKPLLQFHCQANCCNMNKNQVEDIAESQSYLEGNNIK